MSDKHYFKHSPLLYVFFALSAGIILQKNVLLNYSWVICAFITLFILTLIIWRRPVLTSLTVVLMIALFGSVYLKQYNTFSDNHIIHQARFYYGHPVFVQGVVISDVDVKETMRGDKTSFTLDVQSIESGSRRNDVEGKILVNVFREEDISYGDGIILQGKLHKPFNFKTDGKFSYRNYLSNKHIFFILSAKKSSKVEIIAENQGNSVRAEALKLRHFIKEIYSGLLTKNEAGIMHAIVLGDRTGIPEHVRSLFVKTGTAHILAISGLHIGIVSGLMWMILKILRLPRFLQLSGTIILLAGYVFLTGGRPSVIRAFIMATVFFVSLLMEREQNLLNTLAAAGIVLLVFNPNVLFDVGFQLSFGCLFSILLIVPRIESLFQGIINTELSGIRKLVSVFSYSFGVWIGIGGMIMYYFEIVTPISIIANLFIIPLLGIILALSFGMMVSGLFLSKMTFAFALCLKFVLNMTSLMIFIFNKVPFSHFFIKDVNIWVIIVYYCFLILIFSVRIPKRVKKIS